jgi:hypothetical protein
VWYSRPNRLDVYVNGRLVLPLNGETKNGRYILNAPSYPGEFMPNVTSDVTGSNYIDRDTQVLHIIVRGPAPVVVKTYPVILVSFSIPPMTVDEFFGDNIIQNLAAFLNIPPSKVRIVNIVNEQTAGKRRRRRDAQNTVIYLEVGDEPVDGM